MHAILQTPETNIFLMQLTACIFGFDLYHQISQDMVVDYEQLDTYSEC